MADLSEYIRELSKRLAREGYRIIEATPSDKQVAYQFNTSNYRIELIAEPADFAFSPYDDPEDIKQFCESLIKGDTKYANVYAQVIDRNTGISLGDDYIGELTYSENDKTFSGYKRTLLKEAIQQARQKIVELSQQFSQIKPLAI